MHILLYINSKIKATKNGLFFAFFIDFYKKIGRIFRMETFGFLNFLKSALSLPEKAETKEETNPPPKEEISPLQEEKTNAYLLLMDRHNQIKNRRKK